MRTWALLAWTVQRLGAHPLKEKNTVVGALPFINRKTAWNAAVQRTHGTNRNIFNGVKSHRESTTSPYSKTIPSASCRGALSDLFRSVEISSQVTPNARPVKQLVIASTVGTFGFVTGELPGVANRHGDHRTSPNKARPMRKGWRSWDRTGCAVGKV